jgi:hypothetical protein
MKKLINLILLTTFVSNIAIADCDFSTGVTPGPNHTFVYSEECHLKVGTLVQDDATKTQQNTDLTQAIQLKDLALTKSDARVQLWTSTSADLENRLQKVDSMEKTNQWLYFGLGALTVIGAGLVTAKLAGH